MAGLPQALQSALDALICGADEAQLARDARAVSEAYRTRTGTGVRLVSRAGEAAAYAASRMPATFAAVQASLREALEASGLRPQTLLDCGAGTGAASWAADALLELTRATCLEREAVMADTGSRLMAAGSEALAGARWEERDMTENAPLPRAQLVLEGYMLGELSQGERLPVAERMWDAAEQMLLLVEPGTPQGFANLAAVRAHLLSRGAHIAAPCPASATGCPMREGDWCHFAVRVQRTRLHKMLKSADAPFEDEKFCYLALTRTPPAAPCRARVLRHPQIAPGRITLTLCEHGEHATRTVTKKDPLWKRARKTGAGDAL